MTVKPENQVPWAFVDFTEIPREMHQRILNHLNTMSQNKITDYILYLKTMCNFPNSFFKNVTVPPKYWLLPKRGSLVRFDKKKVVWYGFKISGHSRAKFGGSEYGHNLHKVLKQREGVI